MWKCEGCCLKNVEKNKKCKACFKEKGYNCFNTECSICFETPKLESIIVKTNCNHFICINCFCVGGFNMRKCPTCRKELSQAFVYKIGSNKILYTIDEESGCPHCIAKLFTDDTGTEEVDHHHN